MDAGEPYMGFISYVVHFLTCLATEAMTTFPAVQASLLSQFSTIFSCCVLFFPAVYKDVSCVSIRSTDNLCRNNKIVEKLKPCVFIPQLKITISWHISKPFAVLFFKYMHRMHQSYHQFRFAPFLI